MNKIPEDGYWPRFLLGKYPKEDLVVDDFHAVEGEERYYHPAFIEEIDNDMFHMNHCYNKEAVQQVRCEICKGTQFYVGRDSYFTALRCPTCEWEFCVHDG